MGKNNSEEKQCVFPHGGLGCVCQITKFAHVEHENIYMTNKDFVKLTCQHIDLLRKCHY